MMGRLDTADALCPDCTGEKPKYRQRACPTCARRGWVSVCTNCGEVMPCSGTDPNVMDQSRCKLPTRVKENSVEYTVQVLETYVAGWGMVRHMRVRRVNERDLRSIPWEDLQALKDEHLGEDLVAVEVYPRKCDVVDELPMRHLWECPPELGAPNLMGNRARGQ